MKKVGIVLLLLIISSFLVNAGTINIPDDYLTIQAGLNAAESSDTVLVHPGTYYENIFWPDKNGIKLISAGDASNTLIDGRGNSSVVHMSPSNANIDTTSLIKGFTLQNGDNVNYGGGIFINNCNPKLMLLFIKNNIADEKGGGIYCDNSSPTLTDLTISGNSAYYGGGSGGGGGIYCNNSSPTLTGVTILGNSASSGGGGISCDNYSSPTLRGVTISDNSAINGGGIYCKNSSPTIKDVIISGNFANATNPPYFGYGGGIYCNNSSPSLTEVNILDNSASSGGGGIYCDNSSSPTITGATISDNSAIGYGGGGGISCDKYSSPKLTEVTISDNSAGYGGGISCNYHSSPSLTYVTISSNSAYYGGGIYCMNYSSPAMINVLISGNSAHIGGGSGYGGGIFCDSNSYPTLSAVAISNNSAINGGGIYCSNYSSPILSEVTISGNIADNGGGIYCTSSSPSLSKITFFDNSSLKGDGIYIESGNPTIDSCNFVNQDYSIYNKDNSVTIEATNNWFGNSSGPYHPFQNPSGIGDSVNAFVNILPFLTDPDIDAPPIPVQNLHISSIGNDFIELSWDSSPLGDLSGYKICYKTDTTEFFYTDTIDVGNVTSYSLAGLSAGSTYYITAICYDTDGNNSWYSSEVCASVPAVGLQSNGENIPGEYSLSQNYPNPFNPTTIIRYSIPEQAHVNLTIYNISGQCVDILVNQSQEPGCYSVQLDASEFVSGIYFYRIQAGDFTDVKKFILIK